MIFSKFAVRTRGLVQLSVRSPFVVGRGIFLLGDNIPDDVRFLYASQFLVKALKGKDEFLMIHPKEVKHGGMKIPDVDRVFDHV